MQTQSVAWKQYAGTAALPYAYGGPVVFGNMRSVPEDFIVVEELGFAPSGQGEHWLLRVEKKNCNTAWVAGRLAAFAGVREGDVGFCGLKDRHARTTQWFSVFAKKGVELDWREFSESGVVIRDIARHHRKLRRGIHRRNHFTIRVRHAVYQSGGVNRSTLIDRLKIIGRDGVPNYLGEQRFGREGQNLTRAMAWLTGDGARPRRQQRGFWLSAARAAMFNAVLAVRVDDGSWNRLRAGDLANLDGSNSIFTVDAMSDELSRRCETMDIHPTGPLPGRQESAAGAAVAQFEARVLAPFADAMDGLERSGVEASRRALRMRVDQLAWRIGEDTSSEGVRDDVVSLSFSLKPGAFATSVLREIVSAQASTTA